MASRQLEFSQKKLIIDWLGGGEDAVAFVSRADDLIKHFSHPEAALVDEILRRQYNRLNEIADLARNLADFLSVESLPPGSELNLSIIERFAFTSLVGGPFRQGDNVFLSGDEVLKHFRKMAELLGGLEKHIRFQEYQLDRYVNKTKKQNTVLQDFTKNIVMWFLILMHRLPTITDSSDDLQAFEEIYKAFGYTKGENLAKLLKGAVRRQREMSGFQKGKNSAGK